MRLFDSCSTSISFFSCEACIEVGHAGEDYAHLGIALVVELLEKVKQDHRLEKHVGIMESAIQITGFLKTLLNFTLGV